MISRICFWKIQKLAIPDPNFIFKKPTLGYQLKVWKKLLKEWNSDRTINPHCNPCIYTQTHFCEDQRLRGFLRLSTDRSRSFLLAAHERVLSVSLDSCFALHLANDASLSWYESGAGFGKLSQIGSSRVFQYSKRPPIWPTKIKGLYRGVTKVSEYERENSVPWIPDLQLLKNHFRICFEHLSLMNWESFRLRSLLHLQHLFI